MAPTVTSSPVMDVTVPLVKKPGRKPTGRVGKKAKKAERSAEDIFAIGTFNTLSIFTSDLIDTTLFDLDPSTLDDESSRIPGFESEATTPCSLLSPDFNPDLYQIPLPELDELISIPPTPTSDEENKFDASLWTTIEEHDETPRTSSSSDDDSLALFAHESLFVESHALFQDVLPSDLAAPKPVPAPHDVAALPTPITFPVCPDPLRIPNTTTTASGRVLDRDAHNAMERERRVNLRNRFDDLRAQIPSLKDQKAPSLQVLREASRYIAYLLEQENSLLASKEALKAQLEVARQQQQQQLAH